MGKTPTNRELSLAATLARIELAPGRRTERRPTDALPNEASRLPGVDQPRGRMSAGDPSKSLHTCRGATATEEAAAESGPAVEPEQCCSG
jgi:hypothetical protein